MTATNQGRNRIDRVMIIVIFTVIGLIVGIMVQNHWLKKTSIDQQVEAMVEVQSVFRSADTLHSKVTFTEDGQSFNYLYLASLDVKNVSSKMIEQLTLRVRLNTLFEVYKTTYAEERSLLDVTEGNHQLDTINRQVWHSYPFMIEHLSPKTPFSMTMLVYGTTKIPLNRTHIEVESNHDMKRVIAFSGADQQTFRQPKYQRILLIGFLIIICVAINSFLGNRWKFGT